MKNILMICFGDVYNYSGYRNRIYNECTEICKINTTIKLDLVFIDSSIRSNIDSPSLEDFKSININNLYHLTYSKDNAYTLLKLIKKVNEIYDEGGYDFIHAQSFLAGVISLMISSRGNSKKIIYDIHGVMKEELMMKDQGLKLKIKSFLVNLFEKKIVQQSSSVVVVTERMKGYLKKNYNSNEEKIVVIPCLYNKETFFYSSNIRKAVRKELEIEGRLVVIYSGSFNRWSKPEFILKEYNNIKKNTDTDTVLVVLTRQVDIINNVLKANLKDDEYKIYTVSNAQVNNYLNAGDIGLLIREDHPVNQYASPTKFSEYLGTGLPVIVSKNIGDIDKLKEHLQLPNANLRDWILNYLDNVKYYRNNYSEFAFKNLSWDSANNTFRRIYCLNKRENL
jgi:glycosyltransferase involved in cell wall biosynthesis